MNLERFDRRSCLVIARWRLQRMSCDGVCSEALSTCLLQMPHSVCHLVRVFGRQVSLFRRHVLKLCYHTLSTKDTIDLLQHSRHSFRTVKLCHACSIPCICQDTLVCHARIPSKDAFTFHVIQTSAAASWRVFKA